MRILIVEDEKRLAGTLQDLLRRQGYTADVCYDGISGLDNARSDIYDLLVLDAITGQNAISQAKEFCKAADATGIILTKLDGTAKGGVVIGISDQFRIPVRYIGIGEGIDQLKMFDRKEFVNALFGSEAK